MSSRFSTCFSIKQSSSGFGGLNQHKFSGKLASRAYANSLTKLQCDHLRSNSQQHQSKSQSFALSSTAFSVCLALSSYSLPSLITPAFADGPKGGVIVGGSGDISKIDTATTLVNQSSHHMAINWDSYNRNKSGSE